MNSANTEINTVQTLGISPYYVLQPSPISRSAHGLSAAAKKLIFMAMALIPPDLSSLTAVFSYDEFRNALGIEKGGKTLQLFKNTAQECMQCIIHIETEPNKKGKKGWKQFTWISYSAYDEATGLCTIEFNNKLAEYLKSIKNLYAKIFLKDTGQLQSKYAIRFFELAISYSSMAGTAGNNYNRWYFERSIDDLRFMLGIPNASYSRMDVFRKRVLKIPIEEINSANIGLQIAITEKKEGRKTTGIRFDCEKILRKLPAPKKAKEITDQTAVEQPDAAQTEISKEKLDQLYEKYGVIVNFLEDKLAQP
jgi:plasmid replication initiation protein